MSDCPKVHIHIVSIFTYILLFAPFISCHIFSIFSCLSSDDRCGGAVSDIWSPVPARTWCEWLCASHRLHSPTLREELSLSQLHPHDMLQRYLQVRHTHTYKTSVESVSNSCSENTDQWVCVCVSVCSTRLAALRLQPRVQHWEHSRYDPPWWFWYNMDQMVQANQKTRQDWWHIGRGGACTLYWWAETERVHKGLDNSLFFFIFFKCDLIVTPLQICFDNHVTTFMIYIELYLSLPVIASPTKYFRFYAEFLRNFTHKKCSAHF